MASRRRTTTTLMEARDRLEAMRQTVESGSAGSTPERPQRSDVSLYERQAAELVRDGATESERIDLALRRVKERTYGFCVRCDRNIPRDRILAQPLTLTCSTCPPIGEPEPGC